MKTKFTDEIKELMTQSVNWAKLEVEYLKLTAAEKLIILMSALVIGAIVMILLLPVILMLMFALAQVFIDMMPRAVAYVTVSGIVLLILAILFVFRKALVINPIAKFISRLVLERNNNEKN